MEYNRSKTLEQLLSLHGGCGLSLSFNSSCCKRNEQSVVVRRLRANIQDMGFTKKTPPRYGNETGGERRRRERSYILKVQRKSKEQPRFLCFQNTLKTSIYRLQILYMYVNKRRAERMYLSLIVLLAIPTVIIHFDR